MNFENPIWSVPLLFVATFVLAVATGDIVSRFFSEPSTGCSVNVEAMASGNSAA